MQSVSQLHERLVSTLLTSLLTVFCINIFPFLFLPLNVPPPLLAFNQLPKLLLTLYSLAVSTASLVSLHLSPVIFKEVNTCNPATITGTLSRISLDDEDDPKLAAHQEGGVGVNFSSLPGNIPPPNLIVQVWDLQRLTLQYISPKIDEIN